MNVVICTGTQIHFGTLQTSFVYCHTSLIIRAVLCRELISLHSSSEKLEVSPFVFHFKLLSFYLISIKLKTIISYKTRWKTVSVKLFYEFQANAFSSIKQLVSRSVCWVLQGSRPPFIFGLKFPAKESWKKRKGIDI